MNSDISILVAFSAGLFSFLSPCVLPLIPSYLSLLMGEFAKQDTAQDKKQIIIPAIIFIFGFTSVFIILGLSASYLGQVILKNLNLLQKISGVVVIILGLHLTGILKFKFLYREKGLNKFKAGNKYLRALIMGFSLALAWTPCIGPILSSILIYASTSDTIFQGGILLLFYSIGFAIPFLLTAVFLEWTLPKLKKINPYLPIIQKISGVFLIVLGILIYTNNLQIFSF
ncbi:MAG: cytochrome c biogenesis CcdA family protein [Bacillota bacterium]